MPTRNPRILAAMIQSTLEQLEAMDPELSRRVRDALPPETTAAIRSASRISWVDIEHDLALTHAVFAEAGRERAREIMRRMLVANFRAPVLRPLIDGALRLLGRSPDRLLRWAPKVWGHVMRDAGDVVFEAAAPGSGRLRFSDLPPLVADPVYLDGVGAAATALFEVAGTEGIGELEGPDERGRAAIVLSWKLVD